MMAPDERQDLIVLAADLSMKLAVKKLLDRHQALKIRPISFEVELHPTYDSGVLKSGARMLQAQHSNYHHALTMCDRHGCGGDTRSRDALEAEIERQLATHWGDRASAIVIDPELENWLWADSPHVAAVIRWKEGTHDLRLWLERQGFLDSGKPKPHDPKAALEAALRLANTRRSSSLYASLAEKVSFQRCTDAAFLKFAATLQRWFPAENL